MKRITSIDITRGVVMVIMALDHVRDLLHVHSSESPTNLATTTPWLFFTRWITYLCAPAFVFLAGTSAYLSFQKQNDPSAARKFLLTRGLWLLLLEFTVINFGMFFDPGFHTIFFEVIAAIGFGFVVLSLFMRASPKLIGIIGALIIFLHDLYPLLQLKPGTGATIVSCLLSLTALPIGKTHVLVVAYPPLPWLGIMMVGYACGVLFRMDAARRSKRLLQAGIGAVLLFVVLRWTNVYGDPFKWSVQKSPVFTFLSFMNISKYPPSLLFCLVTLGCLFLMLFFFERVQGRFGDWARVYGKVPLFYFVVHFYLIHLLLLVVLRLQGFYWSDLDFASGSFGRPKGQTSGLPLWAVYLVWIFIVAILYRPCRWYGKYKATKGYWWLRYL